MNSAGRSDVDSIPIRYKPRTAHPVRLQLTTLRVNCLAQLLIKHDRVAIVSRSSERGTAESVSRHMLGEQGHREAHPIVLGQHAGLPDNCDRPRQGLRVGPVTLISGYRANSRAPAINLEGDDLPRHATGQPGIQGTPTHASNNLDKHLDVVVGCTRHDYDRPDDR